MENNTTNLTEIQMYLTDKIIYRLLEKGFSKPHKDRFEEFVSAVNYTISPFLREHSPDHIVKFIRDIRRDTLEQSDEYINMIEMVCNLLLLLTLSQEPSIGGSIPQMATDLTCELLKEVYSSTYS